MDTTDPESAPPDLAEADDLIDRLAAAPPTDAPDLADESADVLERVLENREPAEDPS